MKSVFFRLLAALALVPISVSASVLMTVTAPAETRARTGRVTVRRRTESGVSAEITLEFPVES